MTDYAISPQAYREFMSARDRTAYWVQQYHPDDVYSPSTAPTEIDGYVPPSPAMSTHSLPPKMVLAFPDGRSVPIPAPASGSRRSPTSAHSGHHRSRTGSHIPSPLSSGSHTHRRDQDYSPPPTPEEIQILPSRTTHIPSNSNSSSSRSSHNRSKSVPRNHLPPVHDVPFIAPPVPRSGRAPHHQPAAYSPWIAGEVPAHPMNYAHGRPHPSYNNPHAPPPPPQRGPNGMIYSHSAPPVMAGGRPYPSPQDGYYHTDDERTGRSMHREHRGRQQPPLRRGSSDTMSSEDSATYYSPGGADHVVAASPVGSVGTSSSATRAGGSPHSQVSPKKPFFGRLFARFASPGPGRKLRRRHSIDDKMAVRH